MIDQSLLIAEDDPMIQKIYARLLQKEGRVLRIFDNGKEALDQILVQPPDLILLNYSLPEMTGLEIVNQLKKDPKYKSIPVIVITGCGEEWVKEEFFQKGVHQCYQKPPNFEELRKEIDHLIKDNNFSKLNDEVMPTIITKDLSEIESRAYFLFQAHKSRDEYIHKLAQCEAEIKPGLLPYIGKPPDEGLIFIEKYVKINPKLINRAPCDTEITNIINYLEKKWIREQDLHWFIAEREFILDRFPSVKIESLVVHS